jgi:glutathione synthase/RimK-type ligase-like ATP-grasp enzyme
MKKIGVLYGMENTFPMALVDRINQKNAPEVRAESLVTGAFRMDVAPPYKVIVDRISHDIPFYRAYLKNAILHGSQVINNPFWWSADDKFFNYALAAKLGVASPKTVMLPHKDHPPGTTSQSMRNLVYPLNWDEVFEYIGFPAFMKPHLGGGWRNVYKVHNPQELFDAFNQTGDLGMVLQESIEFTDYYRCYVIGQEKVHVMAYDPRQPHERRYAQNVDVTRSPVYDRVVADCLRLCRALGYDMNTVEFAVRDGVPYAIDFLNPAPDADRHSVGDANFEWIVDAVAGLAIAKTAIAEAPAADYHWGRFLAGGLHAHA